MPPRVARAPIRPPTQAQIQRASAPYHPPTDTTTFKDLLLFEERLKMNAAMLRRRKRRYEAFLVTLVVSIIFLAHRSLFAPSELPLVRYITQGLLAVGLSTLVLFFASGMYQERIRYANRYVPHANRALRSINMHLNMRQPPRTIRSTLSFLPFLSPTPSTPTPPIPPSPASSTTSSLGPGNSTSSARSKSPSNTPLVIPPIPPTHNPRGELIFSSRVDRAFKDGYERYRAAFEKRREERMRESRRGRGWLWSLAKGAGIERQGSPLGSASGGASSALRSGERAGLGMRRMGTPPLGGGAGGPRRMSRPGEAGAGTGTSSEGSVSTRSRSSSPATSVAAAHPGGGVRSSTPPIKRKSSGNGTGTGQSTPSRPGTPASAGPAATNGSGDPSGTPTHPMTTRRGSAAAAAVQAALASAQARDGSPRKSSLSSGVVISGGEGQGVKDEVAEGLHMAGEVESARSKANRERAESYSFILGKEEEAEAEAEAARGRREFIIAE